MKVLWKKWVNITKKIASFQANILLTIIYLILIIPIAIILQRFFRNALLGHRYSRSGNSYWIKHKRIKHDFSFAHEQ